MNRIIFNSQILIKEEKMKQITILMILLLLPVVQAGQYSEIKETAINITEGRTIEGKIYEIDLFLWKLNHRTNETYQFSKRRYNDLNYFWETGIGDCTEIARVKKIMYKSIGLRSRTAHGYVNGTKHDYTEYYNGTEWTSTEYRYSGYKLIRVGTNIW